MGKKPYPELPVLIVDDEINFLNSIESILLTNKITNVKKCNRGSNVMSLLEEQKYSLILLDLIMPDVNGEDLLPEIKEEYPEIPVIILTGHADIQKAVKCTKQGAFDLIEKPIDIKPLLLKIRDALEQEEDTILRELNTEDIEFIKNSDIPTLAYHLVLYRYASPELLTDLSQGEMKKAIRKMYREEKENLDTAAPLRNLEKEFFGKMPNALWHSWIMESQADKIRNIKEMLGAKV